jgi:hypothetical protein
MPITESATEPGSFVCRSHRPRDGNARDHQERAAALCCLEQARGRGLPILQRLLALGQCGGAFTSALIASIDDLLDADVAAVHLVVEADHGRTAEMPADAMLGGAAADDLVGEE